MMKKVLVIGIVATMMVGFSAVAFALPTTSSFGNWIVELQASTTGLTAAENQLLVGTSTSSAASDTAKTSLDAEVTVTNTASAEITAYDKPMVASTDTTYSRYKAEIYSQLGATQGKVWNMNLFVGDQYSSADGLITLLGWQPSKNGLAAAGLDPTLYQTVALYVTTNTGTGFVASQSTLLWNIKALAGANSTSTSGEFSTTFAAKTYGTTIAGSGGLGSNAYHLQLVAATPEPGSMLALLSGLVGLVGYGIRRRK